MKGLRERVRQQFTTKGPSLTKQAFKDECDVNNILNKYNKSQLLTHVNQTKGVYGDFSKVTSFQDALNQVHEAQESFLGLPATIRSKFNNDPTLLVDFLSKEENYDEALKLGLLDEQKAQAYLLKKYPPKPEEQPKA